MKDFLQFLAKKLESSIPNLILILIASSILIGSAVFLSNYKGWTYHLMLRDPVFALKGPLYTGYFSQLGCLLWAAAVGICFFSAKILHSLSANKEMFRFLFFSGCMSLLLCLDDTLMFHDEILPYLGVHENFFYLGYLGMITYFLLKYYPTILKTQFFLIGIAFFFFGISMSLDKLPFTFVRSLSMIFEDGAKMIGIISWLLYFTSVGRTAILDVFKNRPEDLQKNIYSANTAV